MHKMQITPSLVLNSSVHCEVKFKSPHWMNLKLS